MVGVRTELTAGVTAEVTFDARREWQKLHSTDNEKSRLHFRVSVNVKYFRWCTRILVPYNNGVMSPTSNRSQCTVLLVEDDADTYELYSEVLASAGFSVIGADNGEDAVERALAVAPHLIVMDYDLRGMDGGLAAELLKRNPRTRHIPIMMLTGHVALRQLEQARSAGCDAFLTKPCSLDDLLGEVQRLLRADDARTANGTVLLVEDDESIRDSIAELLVDDGLTVLKAGHGREALDILHRLPQLPSVILLDLMMPVMDGWTFRSLQLADPRLARIPVVILSATQGLPEHAEQLRINEFLRKPFDPPSLLHAVVRHLG
jgi:CheY-like chemotaxis protein